MTESEQIIRERIHAFLEETRVMTLATCLEGTPWACTLAFAYDEEFHLYFISSAQTRHAQEIARNPAVAVAMHQHQDPPYDPGTAKGLQIQGRAEALTHRAAWRALGIYVKRFPRARTLSMEKLFELQSARIFRIRPERISLLDKGHSPERVEYIPSTL
jgi:uncharacterized protein YhbP (UPF0306 family)